MNTVSVQVLNSNHGIPPRRPKANFPPSIWGDRFLKYDSVDMRTLNRRQVKVEELKNVVRKEVFNTVHEADHNDSTEQMKLMDAVQRLGLSYHFETEIEDALEKMYNITSKHDHTADNIDDMDEDLHSVALRFRLVRQQGHYVSADMFKKFKDKSGRFKDCLVSDIPGMLALYEASHLRIHGEEILDEALVFTTTHLQAFASDQQSTDPLLSSQITYALKRPIRKTPERLHTRHFISLYQQEASHNKSLLQLAKLDFNLLQSLHRKELSVVSRWWKELDLAKKLPFSIRDRIVELYMIFSLWMHSQPKYELARNILAKYIVFTSVIDDTYDSYGTFEELELFTQAIQRWDINFKDQLPEYLQIIYQALLDTFQEFEMVMTEEEKYRDYYSKQGMKDLAQSYFDEARWLDQGYTPSFEEYMHISLDSTAVPIFVGAAMIGMGDDFVTKDMFEWVFSDPKISKATKTIARLMDDMGTYKFERKREHIPSSVECYAKQHGVSEEEACNELNIIVANAWKDLNQEMLGPTVVPRAILTLVLNVAKLVDLLYKDGADAYTRGGKESKEAVTALLVDSVPE